MKRRLQRFSLIVLLLMSGWAYADWKTQMPVFDHVYYADHNDDIYNEFGYDKKKLRNHWLKHGIDEGRPSSPVLHVKYYLNNNSDVARQVGRRNYEEALKHYRQYGIDEGRPSHPRFNIKNYIKANRDVRETFGKRNYRKALTHYVDIGRKERRPLN